jgi:hypothetical protein
MKIDFPFHDTEDMSISRSGIIQELKYALSDVEEGLTECALDRLIESTYEVKQLLDAEINLEYDYRRGAVNLEEKET